MGEVAGAKGSWRDSAEESPLSAGKNNALKIMAKTRLCLERRSNNGKRYVFVKLFCGNPSSATAAKRKPAAAGNKKQKQKFHEIQRFEHNP